MSTKIYRYVQRSMKLSNGKFKKLLLTEYNKERYVLHYRNLKQYLKYGLIMKKVHRILQFKQSTWLKSYIDVNTKLRAESKNEFEKNFFKLMNNAIFGKTMENVRNRSNIKLLTKWHGRYGAKAMIAKPNFQSSTIFDENLIAVELNKLYIKMNKPIYIGQAILDVSKTCMYDFHYGYIKAKYGDNCRCLYTDTDSLIYEFKNVDPYNMIKCDIKMFDTSDYPIDNKYNIPLCNKKIPGLMKDELNGQIMSEFAGLRAKMYSVRVNDIDYIKKAKGVKNYLIKQSICFNDYFDCLNKQNEVAKHQNMIRSYNHEVYSIRQKKIVLSPFDDKRFIKSDNIETLPWGHYSILDNS